MAELKPGWQRVKFGEVVRLNKETCKDPASAGIERVIGLEHLEPGDLRVRSWAHVSDGTTFTNRVRPGQVLFGKRRAYQRKVAVADFDAVCSGDIYVLESADHEHLLPELLPFICQTDAFFEHAVGTSAGSLSPRTSWKSLSQFALALPPLDRQQELSELLTKTSILLQSLLKARGAKENVDDSLWQALASTAECDEIELSDIAQVITGFAFKSSEFADHGTQVIRIGNLYGGAFDAGRDPVYLPSRHASTYEQFATRTGDILISMTGATKAKGIGWPVLVPEATSEYLVNQRVALIRPKKAMMREWLFMNMKSGAFQAQISTGITATAQANLSMKALKTAKLRRPCDSELALAREIWRKTEETSSQLEKRINKARMMIASLMSTLEATKEQ